MRKVLLLCFMLLVIFSLPLFASSFDSSDSSELTEIALEAGAVLGADLLQAHRLQLDRATLPANSDFDKLVADIIGSGSNAGEHSAIRPERYERRARDASRNVTTAATQRTRAVQRT